MTVRPPILLLLAAAMSGFVLHASGDGQAAGRMPPAKPGITTHPYGKTAEGHAVTMFAITNTHGLELRAMTYGGIITSLRIPDRSGVLGDIVLGFDRLDEYLKESPYFGAIIGRYGNRIAGGRFTLDGRSYALPTNNGPNHLHGGRKGFDKAVWQAVPSTSGAAVTFSRTSPDGEEGYPGNLQVRVSYTLTDRNELIIDYHATTDKPTPINLTQHTYFNLTGDVAGDILGHELTIRADRFTPVDATLIPTGELAPVQGTPFDFRKPTAIGARIDQPNEQLVQRQGLRSQLGPEPERPGAGAGRPRRRAEVGPHPRHRDDAAGPAVLYRQLPGWDDQRQGRPRLLAADRALPRDAALPGFSQPSGFSVDDSAPRPGVLDEDRVHIRRGEMRRSW